MELRRLPLMPGCILLPYDTVAGQCAACGEILAGRQTRWCSKKCEQVYHLNHYWNQARHAALERDKACVKCGWTDDLPYYTRRGQFVLWPKAALLGHPDNWLEVDHLIPRVGAGYGTGCWNHQSNLRVLCHKDHVKVTRRQKLERVRAVAS